MHSKSHKKSGEKNKNTGFYLELTIPELFYLLFSKKECPCCKGELSKNKVYDIFSRAELTNPESPNFKKIHTKPESSCSSQYKVYKYFFTCNKCYHSFSISDLAKKSK